jgi:rod shape-determining protein MreC
VRSRQYWIWIVLATFFLVVLNLPLGVSSTLRGCVREGVTPYQAGLTRTLDKVRQTSSAVGSFADVVRRRDELEREVAQLRAQAREAGRVLGENQELRRLLDFRQRLEGRTVACEVVARDDGYGWWQTIRLDKGRDHGIAPGMPVLTDEGVVGRTAEVSAQSCDVLLVSDRSFKASVRFEQEGSFGILHGGGVSLRGTHRLGVLCLPAPFQVEYIRKDIALKPGERVVTSGLGGVFPPGLTVGRVLAVTPDETGLYQQAEVVPAADLARLRHVLVITDFQG